MSNSAQTPLDLHRVNKQAPPAPSKWDVIPIHTSDRATFNDCRRRWDWSSPARLNLTRKVRIHGITWPLFFGTAIHYALEQFYNPVLRQDPVAEFTAFMDLHWNGGIVTEDDITKFGLGDREPRVDSEGNWHVHGLNILLPQADALELYEHHLDMGQGMMRFYKDYAQREDNFTVISVEHDFSVPILQQNGKALYMPDRRKMPDDWTWMNASQEENIYGPLAYVGENDGIIYKQVHARGRTDKVIQDNETGQFGIHDYKTVGRQLDEDYFRHLDLDEQCTTYLHCGEREAEMHDLEYRQLDFIIYEALMKGYPKPPTVLKSGLPSIARSTETTTAEMFEGFIKEKGFEVIYNTDVKMQAYYEFLLTEGDARFINRMPVHRNATQKRNCGSRLHDVALDMLDSPRIYANPSKDYSCLNCAFRGPCIMAEDGSDYISVLEDAYQGNYDR